MNTENRFSIRILSPVHIGCDEVYDPTGFVVDENAGALTAFDPLDFFRSLGPQDKNRYADICRKGTIESIIELYKFMRGKQFRGHSVGMCRGLVVQYQDTLGISVRDRRKIQQELNNFSISRTSFSPTTQKPFIPGSAIKGALRTAYLNHLAKDKRVSYDRRSDILEKGLLDYQKLENDPFRLLKVSDFHPIGPFRTKIVFAVNEKKTPSKFNARGPYQILEIIEPGAIFTGTIRVLEPLSRAVITTPLTEKAAFESASEFYGKEKNREDEELIEAGIPVLIPEDKDDAVSLRLGRHSGAESVTIAGHRNIKIMKKKGDRPDYADKATTFWLAAEMPADYEKTTLRPFGWAAIEQITEVMDAAFEKIRLEEEGEAIQSAVEIPAANIFQELPAVKQPEPVEEVWDESYVSFNAGGGGIVTATSKDGKKAELRGKDKALAATAESLQKKLFEGKRQIDKARVTARKSGKSYGIVSIGPLNP